MSRPPEFDLEFSSESCPCGCRGEAALHEAFESGLSGEAWRQRRPSRPGPGGPRSGPRPPARRPGPRHRPGPFRPGIVPLYEPYAAGPGPDPGTERTRWVQDCLNRIFGLQLPIDGILDAAARSATRRLQQQEGLPATGIVSPATERALQRRCGKAGEPNEQEWESEVSRSSPDYIRWVQSSLNKILGLRLAVDGIMGPATRSAVRSFQQRKGLAVDGILGSQTEASLRALTGTLSLGSVPVSASVAPRSLVLPCGSLALLPCAEITNIDHFAEGKAVAEPSYQTNYNMAIEDLATCIGAALRGFHAYGVIRIIGHASAEGSPELNRALGQARARQVTEDLQKALRSQGLPVGTVGGPSVGAVILKAESVGEERLLIRPERTENDRKLNRRVEIYLRGLLRCGPTKDPNPWQSYPR